MWHRSRYRWLKSSGFLISVYPITHVNNMNNLTINSHLKVLDRRWELRVTVCDEPEGTIKGKLDGILITFDKNDKLILMNWNRGESGLRWRKKKKKAEMWIFIHRLSIARESWKIPEVRFHTYWYTLTMLRYLNHILVYADSVAVFEPCITSICWSYCGIWPMGMCRTF